MAAATLDEISGGRLLLGLGTGGTGLAEMGIRQERRVRALREAIELLRLMLKGGKIQYQGEMYRLVGSGLGFAPLRPSIPIFVATHGRQVLALCGRLADGILLANVGRRKALEAAIQQVRQAEQAAGRAPGSVAIHLRLETCISDDEESALRVLRRRLATRIVRTYPTWDYLEELEITPTERMREAGAARDYGAMEQLLTPGDVRSSALVGSVESVSAQLNDLLVAEVEKVVIRPLTYPGQQLRDTVSRFIVDAWPGVRVAQAVER